MERWWREKSRWETRNAAEGCFSYVASAFSGDFWKWRRCSVFLGSERGSSRGETRGEEERKGESVRKTRGCWERGKKKGGNGLLGWVGAGHKGLGRWV